MKHLLFILGICIPAIAAAQVVKIPPRGIVPPEVLRSAMEATQVLCDQTVKGDMTIAVKKMYPKWKKKEARKVGGAAKLEALLLGKLKEAKAHGVNITLMKARQPISAFEVNFGLEEQVVNGQRVKKGVYREWLVFVPVVQFVTAENRATNPPEIVDMRMEGYQVAICKKGTNDWTFIDGSTMKAFQLRQLFPYLPAKDEDLGLPKIGGKMLRKR